MFRHEDVCIQVAWSGFLAMTARSSPGFFIAWWPCASFWEGLLSSSPPSLFSHQDLLTVLCLLIWESCLRSECPEDVQGPWWWASQDATTTCHSQSPSSAAPAPDIPFHSPSVQVLTYLSQFCVLQNTSLSAVRCPELRGAVTLCSWVIAKQLYSQGALRLR